MNDTHQHNEERRNVAPGSAKSETAIKEREDGWLSRPERGALMGIHFVFWLATALGRWPARQFVRLVALYYFLFDRESRKASRQWLEHVLEREATSRDVYQHLWTFAQATLDRIFFLRGRTSPFDVNRNGDHHLAELRENQQGAVLLGAHLGSFEAMRTGAEEDELNLNIVGHFDNARMVNSLFDRLDPDMRARVIDVGADPISSTLRVRERVESGELVALLGDRVGLNEKTVEIEFMGEPARFPTGPFLLASMLHCPVYLVFGLYYEPNRYELICEPFAESIELPRNNRQGALEDVVRRYVRRLEHFARKAPYNWFNFFDFWNSEDA